MPETSNSPPGGEELGVIRAAGAEEGGCCCAGLTGLGLAVLVTNWLGEEGRDGSAAVGCSCISHGAGVRGHAGSGEAGGLLSDEDGVLGLVAGCRGDVLAILPSSGGVSVCDGGSGGARLTSSGLDEKIQRNCRPLKTVLGNLGRLLLVWRLSGCLLFFESPIVRNSLAKHL